MWRDFYCFAFKNKTIEQKSGNAILVLFAFYFLNLFQKTILMAIGRLYLKHENLLNPTTFKMKEVFENSSTIQILIAFCIVSPILEEFIFRLPVFTTKKNIYFGLTVLIASIVYSISKEIYLIELYMGIFCVITLIVYAYLLPDQDFNKGTYNRHVMLILCTCFSLIHFLNFGLKITEAMIFFVILFAAHFISGLIYGFIRYKYSIFHSIV